MTGFKVTKFGRRQPSFDVARCPICKTWTLNPVTDHCHRHGWVRGEVCISCNYYMTHFDNGLDLGDQRWSLVRAPHEAFAEHALSCPECDPTGPSLDAQPARLCAWPGGCSREASERRLYCGVSDDPGRHGFPPHTATSATQYRKRLLRRSGDLTA